MLTFDRDRHEYRVDGIVVPSVTQVIGAIWPELYAHTNDYARDRGTRVHEAIADDLRGDLVDWMLTSEIEGYVAAARKFIVDSGFVIERSEERVHSGVYGFAGTLDVTGSFHNRKAIADWKTGDPGWQAGLQTAAYAHAWQELTGEVVKERFAVWLHSDGSYTFVHFKNQREDFADFCAALRVYRRKAA